MSDPAERFVEAVARSSAGDAELQVHLRQEAEHLIESGSREDPSWDAAAERLQHPRGWFRRHISWLLAATALIVAAASVWTSWDLLEAFRMAGAWSERLPQVPRLPDPSLADYRHWQQEGAEKERAFIYFGDLSKSRLDDQFGAVVARYPDNPAWYARYAVAYAGSHSALPPDFHQTAARIDPQNAWFPWFAASISARNAVKRDDTYRPRAKSIVTAQPPRFNLKDAKGLQDALDLIDEGNRLQRYDSFPDAQTLAWRSLYPPCRDLPTLLRHALAINDRFPLDANPSMALTARTTFATGLHDEEAFQTALRQWLAMARLKARGTVSRRDLLQLFSALPVFVDSADHLGLKEETSLLLRTYKRSQKLNHRADPPWAENPTRFGGILSSDLIPARVALGDLKPVRLAEQAAGSWITVTGLGLVLLLAGAGCALPRFRYGILPLRLTGILSGLLSARDLCWIFALGSVAPVLWQQALYHLTPLGGRNVGYSDTEELVRYQMAIWLILLLAAPLLVVDWRLQNRLPRFENLTRSLRLEWLIPFLAFLALPVSGTGFLVDKPEAWGSIGMALAAGPALWWLARIAASVFSPQRTAIGPLVALRLIVPTYLLTALLLLLLGPVCRMQERWWMRRDTVIAHPTTALLDQEREEVEKLRAQCLEILAPLDGIR